MWNASFLSIVGLLSIIPYLTLATVTLREDEVKTVIVKEQKLKMSVDIGPPEGYSFNPYFFLNIGGNKLNISSWRNYEAKDSVTIYIKAADGPTIITVNPTNITITPTTIEILPDVGDSSINATFAFKDCTGNQSGYEISAWLFGNVPDEFVLTFDAELAPEPSTTVEPSSTQTSGVCEINANLALLVGSAIALFVGCSLISGNS